LTWTYPTHLLDLSSGPLCFYPPLSLHRGSSDSVTPLDLARHCHTSVTGLRTSSKIRHDFAQEHSTQAEAKPVCTLRIPDSSRSYLLIRPDYIRLGQTRRFPSFWHRRVPGVPAPNKDKGRRLRQTRCLRSTCHLMTPPM
jgi:hypothetical protein